MVNTYKLVNPYIRGEFDTKMKTKNSIEAARKFYNSLSEHFNNSVPKFYFTIQKGGSSKGKFYHFEVEESRKGDDVDFSIRPLEVEDKEKTDKLFVTNFKQFKGRYNKNKKSSKHTSRNSKRGSSKKRKSKRGSSKKRRSKRRSKDDSSSDSPRGSFGDFEEDDFYRSALEYVPVASQPISYLYYDPLIYNLDSVFFPTFYAYLSPYVEFNTRYGDYTMTKIYID